MNEGSSASQAENTQPNGTNVSQMTPEQQTQYLTSLAQTNPAAFGQILQNFLQQQNNGAAAAINASATPSGGPPPNTAPVANSTGAVPQAGNAPYPQPLPQPTGAPAPGVNVPAGMNLAAELARLNYTASIPGSRDLDVVVANRLREADRDGKSYKDALRRMHGVFDYPSNLWIDYYLDRRISINELVDESERNTPAKTAKKPSLDRNASSAASTSAPASRPGPASVKKEKGSSDGGQSTTKPRRATLNSMATFYDSTPDPKDDGIPEPPAKEPTPPTEVQTMGLRGNAFTDADVKYLIDFVNWVCAHKDWSVTKMYKKLYKRAPHHSAASWAGKAKTLPVIAKIIDASAQDEEEEEEGDDYQEMEVDETPEAEPQLSASGRRRRQVGGIGTAVTDNDLEDMADWIAENGDNWEEMSGKMRWFPFAETHDKRSWQAWTETYRRYQSDIDNMVKKKRRRAQASGPSGGKRPRNE